MTRLSVNINKIATLRNARGGRNPNVVATALKCEKFGAQGITVHPRPDERHITKKDVFDLKPLLTTEFNIEGNPDERFIEIVRDVHPAQVTLVPDGPNQLTSNAGWDCVKNLDYLTSLVKLFKEQGIRVSIFVDTDLENIRAAAKTGADRVELYTEPYAREYGIDKEVYIPGKIFSLVISKKKSDRAAEEAHRVGLGLNAGHDLSLVNLRYFAENIPYLDEVSIGHALWCDALDFGMEDTIRRYRACLTIER